MCYAIVINSITKKYYPLSGIIIQYRKKNFVEIYYLNTTLNYYVSLGGSAMCNLNPIVSNKSTATAVY